MKKLSFVLLLGLLAPFFAHAMTVAEQDARIKAIAKHIRHTYWKSGHEDVTSGETRMTKALLDEHVRKGNRRGFEDWLDQDQISSLYRCHYSKNCSLYLIEVGGQYWGGDGVMAHFILLYLKSGKYYEIKHTIYSE